MMGTLMLNLKTVFKRNASFTRKFQRDEDGVVAVEFAIVAVPFMMLLFGIIELAVIFFMGSSLQSATFEASRLIRTGQFTSGDEAQFKTEVCTNMKGGNTAAIAACESNLEVTVLLLSDFSSSTSFGGGATVPTDSSGDPINYTASAGGDTVIVTATFKHVLSLPGSFTQLANVDGENARNIVSVTAFRNEPF